MLATLAALALTLSVAGGAPIASRYLECSYIEAGAPGPVGNQLLISGNDSALIRREGERILVGTSASNGPRDFEEISCSGGEATITNIDAIRYTPSPGRPRTEQQLFIDEGGGRFGPGASPEMTGPELELELRYPPGDDYRPHIQL